MESGLRVLGRLTMLSLGAAALGACDNGLPDDPPATTSTPSVLGNGSRIRDIMNPALPTHPATGDGVTITGATFLLVDTYDETHNGKSKGTVYLQDVSPTPLALPFSGASLYSPTYVPSNLQPAPGDVLDLRGTFTVSASLGTAIFSAGTSLTQIDDPTVTPRFEYELPQPLVIQASDLDTYATGLQWESMLVTIENITFPDDISDSEGRDTIHIMSDTSTNGPTLDNELFDVATWNSSQTSPPLAQGKTASVTGIVTWFFNFHIAPRSPADIVVQ